MGSYIRYILLILIILIIFPNIVLAENISNQITKNSMSISILENNFNKIDEINNLKIDTLISEFNSQKKILDEEQDHLDTNIQFIQIWMATISILLALGGYFGWKRLKTSMELDIKEKVTEEIKYDVLELRKLIRTTAEEPIQKLEKDTKLITSILENPESQRRYLDKLIEEKRNIENNEDPEGGNENAFD